MENVQIADDVILSIAGVSATRVKGVKSLYGDLTDNIITTMSGNALKKGVKFEKNEDDSLDISLNVILENGSNVKTVSKQIQEKVKEYVENMLDLEVASVNVNIASVENKEE